MPRPAYCALAPLILLVVAGCASDTADQALSQGDRAMHRLRYTEAADYYTVAIEAEANRADAYLGRGRAYWAMSSFEDAVADLDRAITLDSTLLWAYYFRGSSLLQLGRFEEGIADLADATRAETLPLEDQMRAHYLRAVAYMNLEQYDDGIDALTAAIALQPGHPFYYFERAQLYEATDQTEAAIADFEQYLALAGPGADADGMAALAQQRLGALRDETGGATVGV